MPITSLAFVGHLSFYSNLSWVHNYLARKQLLWGAENEPFHWCVCQSTTRDIS